MKRKIILVSLLILVTILGIAIIRIKTNEPPDNEINWARKMLSEAELVKSPGFAKENYREAIKYYDSAMAEWSRENERFILFRNYKEIRELAKKSLESSKHAIDNAKKNVSKIEDKLEIRIDELGKRIRKFEEDFGNFLINSKHREEIVKSKLQYSEGVLAYKNKNYSLCKSKLDSVEITINRVFVPYIEMFNLYLKEYPKWKEMMEQTISHSQKTRSYAIIVDKLARKLMIYKDGKVLKCFTVELGVNWIGDKQQQGDKSTPEGLYKITDKKSNGQTKYYKALLLDYPNEDDKKRFALNRKNGIIKPEAKIGNLIEIHGHGGKGIDWTDGCIALKDTDMDIIFKLSPVGTKVTIVGSAKSLDEHFNKVK